ncbi:MULTISPECIES: hypothetical protein [Acinetobacter]|uniref:Uncharacterized protein n=2 Tax=Acinetobacter johnsonii TaxID=40214 RepID=N9CNY8_ACIJO|nr:MULTISPECIES: hypothetical protein [Acinetobacter]EEY97565.1 hypothetical protein HMPREF0016_00648 [Acinetobacter johnsonii SH046]ENV72239.1 hypothetical protein F946_01713 [Acinetobacter johnsonii ANC 3681]OOW16630.1 hypothetical protein MF4640_01100 [Acinetobacter sp. MF4640]QQT56841.1 hypothetical protein I6I50_10645 [Acinetobacter johnsonii]HRM31109.1 hypothetical protein [Acinetobacter johnsonii]
MNKSLISILITATLGLSQSYAMTALNDEELSEVEGQSLMNLEFQQGTNTTDAQGKTYNQSNIGFYKLALSAELELNANIKKLQLGCGGDNNSIRANSCDIDIDHISLSGLPDDANYTSDQRAATSALITNPFIQFAIKNPTSAATREVLGFRVSAEKIKGLMTLGTENTSTPNGINTFSGYMKTKTASGTAVTEARTMTYADTGLQIKGKVTGTILFIPTTLDYTSDNYNLTLSSTTAPFTINSTIVSGTRMKDVTLKGSGTVGQINFSGPLTATVLGGVPLNKQVTGNITGLKTDITVNQSLGLIHALYLNNPASLSLQSQDILWTGAAVGANKGWWLAMEDEVELGSLSPTTKVAITNEVLKQTIAGINKDLTEHPRPCGDLLFQCALGSDLAVGNVPMNSTTLDFPLTNLSLQGQNFRSNCYGGLKFC